MTSAQQSPEQVVDSAFRAIGRRDWMVLRDLMDPSALERARQEHLGMLILVAEQRRAGKAVGGGFNPGEVVIADHIATVGNSKASRFGNATIAQLAALSPADFYVRWLDAAYAPGRANGVEDIVDRERTIVGGLTVGDEAWVVYREDGRWQEGDLLHVTTPGSPDVLPLRRSNGHWRILPNFELAHGPDITDMFERSTLRYAPAPARRQVTRRPFAREGSPRHVDAVPSPIAVVDSAFDALGKMECSRFTTMVDPQRLADFQDGAIRKLVAVLAMQKIQSANDSQPGMSLGITLGNSDVAKAGNERIEIIPGHPTVDELRRLSPPTFFTNWCKAVFPSLQPDGATPTRHYLGTIFEGEDVAHVLYRSSAIVFDLPAQVMRMPLRYTDGHWRILLNQEFDERSVLATSMLR